MTYRCHLELHFHRLFLAISDFEKFALRETEQACDDIAREHIDLVVERQHVTIVEAAGSLNLVFRVRELPLQLEEVLVGLEIRIGFRDCKQALQRIREHIFGLRLVRGGTGLHRSGARSGHFLKHAGLMRGIALDRIDEIRNQIVAALELHIDIAPGLAHAIAQGHKAVKQRDNIEYGKYGNNNDDQRRIHRICRC